MLLENLREEGAALDSWVAPSLGDVNEEIEASNEAPSLGVGTRLSLRILRQRLDEIESSFSKNQLLKVT